MVAYCVHCEVAAAGWAWASEAGISSAKRQRVQQREDSPQVWAAGPGRRSKCRTRPEGARCRPCSRYREGVALAKEGDRRSSPACLTCMFRPSSLRAGSNRSLVDEERGWNEWSALQGGPRRANSAELTEDIVDVLAETGRVRAEARAEAEDVRGHEAGRRERKAARQPSVRSGAKMKAASLLTCPIQRSASNLLRKPRRRRAHRWGCPGHRSHEDQA